MQKTMGKWCGLAVVAMFLGGGCDDMKKPEEKMLQAPFNPTAMHRFHDPMVDNAAAYDMSVADIHFVPHTSHLNDLGVRRLDRLAVILEKYGGTVRYETHSTDKDANVARLAEVGRYLSDLDLDMAKVEIVEGMSGGRGMSATDAVAARRRVLGVTQTAGAAPPSSSE